MTDVELNGFENMLVNTDIFRSAKEKKGKDTGFPITNVGNDGFGLFFHQ